MTFVGGQVQWNNHSVQVIEYYRYTRASNKKEKKMNSEN